MNRWYIRKCGDAAISNVCGVLPFNVAIVVGRAAGLHGLALLLLLLHMVGRTCPSEDCVLENRIMV